MKLSGTSLMVLVLSVALQSGAAEDGKIERDQEVVLRHFRPALAASGRVGRLYYRSDCEASRMEAVPFSRVTGHRPQKGKTGLAAVREMFRNQKEITSTEESGIIRVRIGNVPDAILQTRISLIRLNPKQQYNPREAIFAIYETEELKAAMRRLGFQLPVILVSGPLALPEEGLPHLPASIRNVTMDEALDVIARTFKGIVIYGACATPKPGGGRFFSIHFAPVSEF